MQGVLLQTWNCFGTAMDLKAVLRRRGPPDAHRMVHPEVRAALNRADVFCMQEVWIPDAVELFDSLEHEHKIRDHGGWGLRPFTITGPGLGLASRYPVVEHEMRPFRTPGCGSDGLARKGMLLARLRLGDDPRRELDVITTHLQAGEGRRRRRVRAAQLQELGEAVEELGSDERPLILCGDLNIDGLAPARSGEYAAVVRALPDLEDLGAPADEPTMCPTAELNTLAHRYWSAEPLQRLDYLWYRPPRSGWARAVQVERTLNGRLSPLDGAPATYASDHFGVSVRVEVKPGGPSPEPPPAVEPANLGGG